MNPILFYRKQLEFRNKVFLIRERRLEARRQQHEQAREAWEDECFKRQKWRDACERRTCPDCGLHERVEGPARDGDMTRQICRIFVRKHLRDLLRRLAGLNANYGGTHRVSAAEWRDWNSGSPGFRKCGPAMWENVVRAVEDG